MSRTGRLKILSRRAFRNGSWITNSPKLKLMRNTPPFLLQQFCAVSVNICLWLSCACAQDSIRPSLSAETTPDDRAGWWPTQAMPKALVRTQNQNEFPPPRASCEMMAQSVAGLAAKAVNEGRADEMVWVGIDNIDVEDWFARLLKRQPQLELRGTFALWDLVDRYAKKGIIKGYILYSSNHSKGELSQHRPAIDCSVNVATSLAEIGRAHV